MFILDFFRNASQSSTEEKVKALEKKVLELETVYTELSSVTKKVTLFSIKTSQELDKLVKILQHEEREELNTLLEKKTDDVYN